MTDLRTQLQEGLGDSYALERELGRGGMATVFLALDTKHDRPVALKVLHPELAASLGPDRFLREIKLAARLQHPHVLTVLDSGDANGRLWFTMPFVEGESLRDRLRRERQLPVDDALRIAREAAQALQYAHDHGVVHRDIKPENLMLTRDGNTLVADFGIARALGAAGEDRLTETGLAIGTPAYMSPEQAAGDRGLDARTDIYSLAAVLYEMLAGEPPFTGATTQAMLVRRLTEPPPSVRTTRPNVPESVDQAIRKSLAPVAADRFGTMAQLGQVLQGGSAAIPTGERTAAVPASGSPSSATPASSPAVAAPPAALGRRRVPVAAAAMLIGLLIGGGALFAWRRSHPDVVAGDGTERRIAVLPFQNMGDSADAYFADGMTDAVRGKLTALPSMRVIGSNSSGQYKGTTKTPQEIGRELGVDYLLVGKVRWAKLPGGASRVQVSPELIDTRTADARWQRPFDAALTDIFQVQGDIAGQVAQALDVELGSRQQEALAAKPTQNLAAYDLYLKGQAQLAFGPGPATLRQAVGYFEQAVALDSGFVAAWVWLSASSGLMYINGVPLPAVADRARSAAERALALAPQDPRAYWALGGYYRVIAQPERAVEQFTKGLAFGPNDPSLLRGLGISETALGRWDAAVEHYRRGLRLDPRSANTQGALGDALISLHRLDEARAANDAALALQPSSLGLLNSRVLIQLARGDLNAARATLAQPPAGVDLPTFVAYMATYYDLYWALSDEQRALVTRLTPASFDGDASTWGLALAGIYEMRGDRRRAAAFGDSARAALEQQLIASPEDAQRHVLLGLALAFMGRKDAALREARRGIATGGGDATNLPYFQHQLVRAYIVLGEPEPAIDLLEKLLKEPYFLTPAWLRIDPTFDQLRSNPRFQRLVSRTS